MEKRERVFAVFEQLAPTYDAGNTRISLGLERFWKKALIDAVVTQVRPGGTVLDVCCGTGDIALAIARKRPDVAVTGLDFSPAMLAVGTAKDTQRTIRWQRGDALHLPFPNHIFSAVTISFGLRNTTDYGQVLREMYRVTEPGGSLSCLDSYVPTNRCIRPAYELYFRHLMPWLGGGACHVGAYRWLWQSTEQFISSHDVTGLLAAIGWQHVQERPFLFGACVLHGGQKKG